MRSEPTAKLRAGSPATTINGCPVHIVRKTKTSLGSESPMGATLIGAAGWPVGVSATAVSAQTAARPWEAETLPSDATVVL